MLNYKKINRYLIDYQTTEFIVTISDLNTYQYEQLLKYLLTHFNQYNLLTHKKSLKQIINHPIIIDIVKSTDITDSNTPDYQFEQSIGLDHYIIQLYQTELKMYVELNDFTINTFNIDGMITNLLIIMNKTLILYTQETKLQLIDDLQFYLNQYKNKPQFLLFKNLNQVFSDYIISLKPKGKPCFLIIHNTGLWLVHPPYQFNLIIEPNETINNLLHSFHMTVFDGFLIKPINKNFNTFNQKYWYLCTDCLVFSKNNVTQKPYYDRIDYAKVLSSLMSTYIQESFLKLSLQSTRLSHHPDDFYNHIQYLLLLSQNLNYNYEGFMFKNRNQNDNYQWIDSNQLTLNLKVKDSKLYTSDDYIFEQYKNEHDSFLKHHIISLTWNNVLKKLETTNEKNKNGVDTLEDINHKWEVMMNPITWQDLQNKTTNYLKYHMNQFLKNWFDTHIHNHDKILNISQDDDITLLLPVTDPKNRVTLKSNTKTDIIILTSLSTYWENEEKLNQLIKQCDLVLKPNGKILFFNLSGDHVQYLFKDKNVTMIKIGPVQFELDNHLLTTTQSHVVTKENLVYLQDLTLKLKKYNIELKQFNNIESEYFSLTDQILASLYCYGYYQKN